MKGFSIMINEKILNNAVLLYFILLVMLVVYKMIIDVDIFDIFYFMAMLCSIIKYFMIIKEK